MGLMDAQALLADDLDISGTATETTTSNVIDLGDAEKGAGTPLRINARITTAVTSTGSSTTEFKVISSAAEGLGTPTTHWTSGALAKATLVAGYKLAIPPLPDEGLHQYLAITATNAVAVTDTGALHASVVADVQTDRDTG